MEENTSSLELLAVTQLSVMETAWGSSGQAVLITVLKIFFFFNICIYFWLCLVYIALLASSRGYSPVTVHRLLIAVASLIMEHGL